MKAFYKTHGIYLYNQWNYFQRECMDKWRSGDFSLQTWRIPLEAFASNNTNERLSALMGNAKTNPTAALFLIL